MAEFLRYTSSALGFELDATRILELEDTDSLGILVSAAVHAARMMVDAGAASVPYAWREADLPTLNALLCGIAGRLPSVRAVYLPAEASLVGGVWLTPQELLPAALTLVREREWVECSTPDGSDGLCLEYDASGAEHGAERPYELVVWGAVWGPRAEEARAELGITSV
jgi:hypothetical protein